jgi:PAS domain S-box-containing protein
VPFVAVALAIAGRLLLDPLLGSKFPFATVFFAVVVSALYGGVRPALLAVALGVVGADYYLLPPRGSFAVAGRDEGLGLILFSVTGLGISLLGGSLHSARQRAEEYAASLREHAALLESRVADRTAALATSEARFRRVLEGVPTGVLAVDEHGAIVLANDRVEEMFGYARDELIGKPIETLVPEGLQDRHAAHRLAFLAAPTRIAPSARHGLRGLRKDGVEMPVQIGLSPLHLPDGDLVLGAVIDLSDAHRTAELRREASAVLEVFRLTLEAMRDYGIFRLDAEGRIVTWNAGAQAIKGYEQDEIVGEPSSVFYPPEAAATAAELLAQAAATGHADDEGWRVRKDGSRFWASVVVSALREPDTQTLLGFVKITRDLSDRKREEDDRATALADKTALLQEVHHRVKNNLQIIASLLNLQARQIGEPGRAHLLEAQGRVRSIALLHESLYQSDDFGRVDMREYVERFVTTLRQTYRPCPRVVTSLDAVHLPVDMAVPCGLIMNELVTNVLKHAFEGTSPDDEVRVGVTSRDDVIRIVVSDNGRGFPAAVDPTTGATMGLSLVRDLAAQLRGRASFEGRGGVTCTITFPRPTPKLPTAG